MRARLLLSLLLAGCASTRPTLGPDHPADPSRGGRPLASVGAALAPDFVPEAGPALPSHQGHHHASPQ